jgi:homoserine O-acetyltransferase/O-succinyltransferase
MQALMTYRSKSSFDRRFGRHQQSTPEALFMAQSYLRYQGQKFVQRFDANCYIALTRLLDTHDIVRGRGSDLKSVLGSLDVDALVVGVYSDALYPLEDQLEIHQAFQRSRFVVLDSDEGHDGFLLELDVLDSIIRNWMHEHVYTKHQLRQRTEFVAGQQPIMKDNKVSLCGEE